LFHPCMVGSLKRVDELPQLINVLTKIQLLAKKEVLYEARDDLRLADKWQK